MSAAPMRAASSANAPGASAFSRRAASTSVSAMSTAVYAAGFTMIDGLSSRTTSRTWSRSDRSSIERSHATTRPRPCSERSSSNPTCPFTPVTRIVGSGFTPTSRIDFGFAQSLAGRILRGEQRLEIDRPFDSDFGIVPDDAALVLGEPVIGRFVEELGGLRQDDESMRKTGRHPQLLVVVVRQHHTDPLAEGRRALANIDDDVEYFALDNAHEFALRMLDLIMQPAQHALRRA